MWLSAMADVTASASSVCPTTDIQSDRKTDLPANSTLPLAEDCRSSFNARQDPGHGVTGSRSSGRDVTTSDSDSGAVDDAEVTLSDDVAMTTGSAPDGGYGWVVVVASFFNAFILDGVGSCYGLIFPHVMEKFGTSASVASFAGSLFNAFLIMGSVSAVLVRRFGYRLVAMSGGVLACLAFILSSVSPNIFVFVLSYGLFTGCACGLVFLPSIVIVNGYFHEKRGLTNGIITSGSGAGLLVLAQLVNYLLEEFSLDSTLLVLAGVLLNMCVFASLYCPPESTHRRGAVRKDVSVVKADSGGSTDSGHLSPASICPSLDTISTIGREPDCSADKNSKAKKDGELEHGKYPDNNHFDTDKHVCTDEEAAQNGCNKPGTQSIDRDTSEHVVKEEEEECACGVNDPEIDRDVAAQSISPQVEIRAGAGVTGQADEWNSSPRVNPSHCKDRITVSPYQAVEACHMIASSLVHKGALRRPYVGMERDTRQLWKSAHLLPTTPAPPHPGVTHSSAYDVTAWGSTDAKITQNSDGLVPLAERSHYLHKHQYRRQQHSHDNLFHATGDDHHDRQAYTHFSQNQMRPSHPHFRQHYHQHDRHDHQLPHHHHHHHDHRRHHHHHFHKYHQLVPQRSCHQHPHHSSHLCELDKGSNFYLTGSISMLKNLQVKHILHLASSHDGGHFPRTDSHFSKSNLSQGSKSHLSHLSKSPSYLSHNFPFSSKSNISRGSKSQLSQQSALLPPVEADSSLWRASHLDIRENLMSYSSKPSLQSPSEALLDHPTQVSGLRKKNTPSLPGISHSQWSVDLECTRVVNALALDSSSESLALPTVGYSLQQLLRIPCFYLFCIGSCLIQIGYPIPSIFLADLAYHQGLNASHTTVLMCVMGGLNIAGRLLSGLLANLGVKPLTLLYASLLLGGVACLLTPLYTTFWSLVLFAGLFGFFLGFFPPVQPLVIVEYFGLDSLASVFGLLTTIKGASSMLGPPLAGWVYDASGQYPMSFVFGGAVFLLSSAVHVAMPWFRPQ